MTVTGSPRIEESLVSEWDFELNGDLDPTQIARWSWKKHWWRCPNGHSYHSAPATRSKGRGCPYCAGVKVLIGFNDLGTVRPEIASTWDYERNGSLRPEHVPEFCDTHVWWKCDKGHSWKLRIAVRSQGIGCRYCSNMAVLPGFNDLKSNHPEIANQIDMSVTSVDASQIVSKSPRSLDWVCSLGHKWKAAVKTRVAGRGCPYCAGVKVLVGFNDLASTSPDIAKQWDKEKNEISPSEVHHGSKKRAWWKCPDGHSWSAVIQSRRIRGCPHCALAGTSQSEQELFTVIEKRLLNSENRVKVHLHGWARGIEVDVLGIWKGKKVAIEYDGSYFHKDTYEKDERKTIALLGAGYAVIRVREQNNWSLAPLSVNHPYLLQMNHQFGSPMDQIAEEIFVWLESIEGEKDE